MNGLTLYDVWDIFLSRPYMYLRNINVNPSLNIHEQTIYKTVLSAWATECIGVNSFLFMLKLYYKAHFKLWSVKRLDEDDFSVAV